MKRPDLDAPVAAAMKGNAQVRTALARLRPSERDAARKAISEAITAQAAAQLKARRP